MSRVNFQALADLDAKTAGTSRDFGGVLLRCEFNLTYRRKRGVKMIESAGEDGTPPEFIKVHAESWKKVLIWNITRYGGLPWIPSFQGGENDELIGESELSLGKLPSDGTNFYHIVGGIITWGMYKPPQESGGFQTVIDPFIAGTSNVIYEDQHFKAMFPDSQGGIF